MKAAPVNSMDVIRAKPRRFSRVAIFALGIALLAGALAALFSLTRTSSGIAVERAGIVTDTVRRGDLARTISASGALAPQEVHIVAAIEPGVVESLLVKPGAYVNAQTPIARLSNPDLDASVMTARSAVAAALAQLVSVEQQAKESALVQRSAYVSAQAQADTESTNVSADSELHREGYIADQALRIAEIKATQSRAQLGVARSQITVDAAEQNAKVAAARAEVAQAEAQLQAKEAEVDALMVRARSPGVVESVAVDPGARLDVGAELARVADQRDLKAVLRVPEGQVPSITIGMPVSIDAGNGSVRGHVARIAPSAQDGTVAVDVAFARALPVGARPDLNVDGTIDLQTLRNVLSVARPAGAADDTLLSLYRINQDRSQARLVQVRLGRGSTDRIEVLYGLDAGDVVIVSDTTAYGGAAVLRLH